MDRRTTARYRKVTHTLSVQDPRGKQQSEEQKREANKDRTNVRPEEQSGRLYAGVNVVLSVLTSIYGIVNNRPAVKIYVTLCVNGRK